MQLLAKSQRIDKLFYEASIDVQFELISWLHQLYLPIHRMLYVG